MIAGAAVAATVYTVTNAPSSAPTGYYYEPSSGLWYYYDGTTTTPMAPGFEPPPGSGEKFTLVQKTQDNKTGYELDVSLKLVGAHTLHLRAEYKFTKSGQDYCLEDSETATPPCVWEYDASTYNYFPPLGKALGLIDVTHGAIDFLPNSGTAEAWGWLDNHPQDKATADYHASAIAWTS